MKTKKCQSLSIDSATKYPCLEAITRPYVPTPDAAYYLAYAEQTMRMHFSNGCYDPRLSPIKVGRRIMWKTAGLREILGVA